MDGRIYIFIVVTTVSSQGGWVTEISVRNCNSNLNHCWVFVKNMTGPISILWGDGRKRQELQYIRMQETNAKLEEMGALQMQSHMDLLHQKVFIHLLCHVCSHKVSTTTHEPEGQRGYCRIDTSFEVYEDILPAGTVLCWKSLPSFYLTSWMLCLLFSTQRIASSSHRILH